MVSHIKLAAANGHLNIVRFLIGTRESCGDDDHDDDDDGPSTLDLAVLNGHLEVVRFMCESYYERGSSHTMVDAVQSQRFDILQLLCEHRDLESSAKFALELAVKRRLVAYVKLLFEADPACLASAKLNFCADLVNTAAADGFLELIQFFHAHDQHFRFTHKAMHNAAVNDHLEIVKFLHEHRSEGCNMQTLFESSVQVAEFLCAYVRWQSPSARSTRRRERGEYCWWRCSSRALLIVWERRRMRTSDALKQTASQVKDIYKANRQHFVIGMYRLN